MKSDMKRKKEDQSIHRSILQRSWCLPGLLLVTLWPCMVHLDRVRTWMEEENWYPDIQYIDDYFMHIKSCTFLFLAGWMALLLLLVLLQRIKGSHRWKSMESLPILLAKAPDICSMLSRYQAPVLCYSSSISCFMLISSSSSLLSLKSLSERSTYIS